VKTRFGLEAQLIKGKGGVFEVRLDGQTLFSKKVVGRFPDAGEVEEVLAERLAG
jgi:selenoprotein W-related protein